MDLLFSLPIASYFLAPGATSWSTSLNFLFFYMTWTTLVLSHSPLRIRIVGTLSIRIIFWLIPALISLLFDLAVPSLSESIKYGGRTALPPRNVKKLSEVVGLGILNLGVLTALEGATSLASTHLFKTPEFKAGTTLPLPWQLAKHIIVLFTLRETLHFYIHRFLLHGSSSRGIPSYHKRSNLHCRASPPYSFLLFADHPLSLVLHRWIPIYLPSLLVRPHLLTYFLFVSLCTLEETLAMSGYSIVPGIIMGGMTQRAAIHYASGGTSNFGAWGLLDWVHGTGKGRDVLDDVKAEADKHHWKEGSRKKVDDGRSKFEEGWDSLRNKDGAKGSRKKTTKKS